MNINNFNEVTAAYKEYEKLSHILSDLSERETADSIAIWFDIDAETERYLDVSVGQLRDLVKGLQKDYRNTLSNLGVTGLPYTY